MCSPWRVLSLLNAQRNMCLFQSYLKHNFQKSTIKRRKNSRAYCFTDLFLFSDFDKKTQMLNI